MPRRKSARVTSTPDPSLSYQTIKVPRNLLKVFLAVVGLAGLAYYNGTLVSASHPPIIATGHWRTAEYADILKELRSEMEPQPIKLLGQAEEGRLSAENAYSILTEAKLLPPNANVAFIEAGRGSMQITVLGPDGTEQFQSLAGGFPKTGVEDDAYTDQLSALNALSNWKADHPIALAVLYGSFHHILRDNEEAIVKNKAELPNSVTTRGASFDAKKIKVMCTPPGKTEEDSDLNATALVQDLLKRFETTPVLVMREVTVNGQIRKIAWGWKQPGRYVDLGSGKISLIDPKTGAQIGNEQQIDPNDTAAAIAQKIRSVQQNT